MTANKPTNMIKYKFSNEITPKLIKTGNCQKKE